MMHYLGRSKKYDCDCYSLGLHEKQLLIKALSVSMIDFLSRLERDSLMLDVTSFFNCYYGDLFELHWKMQKHYPEFDLSMMSNNFTKFEIKTISES